MKKYVIILNYESGSVDCLFVGNCPTDKDLELFIEEDLDYSLSNCHWMNVDHPLPRIVNF